MKKSHLFIKKTTAFIFLAFLTIQLTGQSLEEAKNLYNQGAEAFNNESYEESINALEQSIDIIEFLGPDAEQIKIQATNLLPRAYREYAKSIYKSDIDKAIDASNKAIESAKDVNNDDGVQKGKQLLSRFHSAKGKQAYKNDKQEAAYESFNAAIKADSSYSMSYYLAGISARALEKSEEFKEVMSKGQKVAQQENDKKVESKIISLAQKHFFNQAVQTQKDGDNDKAISLLNDALSFDNDFEDGHYLLARSFNEIKEYDKAIKHANKALSLNTGTKEDKAKIYFELGRAYQGQQNKAEACKAYKKAKYGAFLKSSEYQINEVLKCK